MNTRNLFREYLFVFYLIAALVSCSESQTDNLAIPSVLGSSQKCDPSEESTNPCVVEKTNVVVTDRRGENVTSWRNEQASSTVSVDVPMGVYQNKSIQLTVNDLVPSSIKLGVSIFGVTGSAVAAPALICSSEGQQAQSCKVPENSYWTNLSSNGTDIVGENGQRVITIPEGYYDGSEKVSIVDSNLNPENLLNTASIFGTQGVMERNVAIDCVDGEFNAGVCNTKPNRYIYSEAFGGRSKICDPAIPQHNQSCWWQMNGDFYYTPNPISDRIGNWRNPSAASYLQADLASGLYWNIDYFFPEANLRPENIKNGVSLFGVTGTYTATASPSSPYRSTAFRNRSTVPITQVEETFSYRGQPLPSGYREVPDINKDYLPPLAVTSGPEFQKVTRGTNLWETGVERKVCGNCATCTTLSNRINDCADLHGVKPSWDAGVAGKISWDGRQKANGGQGSWTLVTVGHSTKINGEVCDSGCNEIWRDDTTGLLWDYHGVVPSWCEAAGNGISDACQSWNTGTPYFNGECSGTKLDARWRLPSDGDFLQGEVDGLRWVLPNMGGVFWTAQGNVFLAQVGYLTFTDLYGGGLSGGQVFCVGRHQ